MPRMGVYMVVLVDHTPRTISGGNTPRELLSQLLTSCDLSQPSHCLQVGLYTSKTSSEIRWWTSIEPLFE